MKETRMIKTAERQVDERRTARVSGAPSGLIRFRRVESRFPLVRAYEVEMVGNGDVRRRRLRRGQAIRNLAKNFGRPEARSFVMAADEAWAQGRTAWVVEVRATT
jgi:hypothetical protein